jgi:hypothetical protein
MGILSDYFAATAAKIPIWSLCLETLWICAPELIANPALEFERGF